MNLRYGFIKMDSFKLQQIIIKKIELLIDKNLGDKTRLEQIQLKLAQGLPLFSENQAYIDALLLDNLSDEEIKVIKRDVESATLKEYHLDEQKLFHCICCGNVQKSFGSGGMCSGCYLDYNIKISKFVTKPIRGGF